MVQRRWLAFAVVACLLLAACSAPATPPTATTAAAPPTRAPTIAPTIAPTSTTAVIAPTAGPASGSTTPAVTAKATVPVNAQGQVIWTQVFPSGPGQALVLQNCGTCHTYDRIVTGQRTAKAWAAVQADHASKVPNLSAQDQTTLFSYLAANFGPNNPEPIIPTSQPSGPSSPV